MEKITIKVVVDGEELTPISMGIVHEDPIYKDDIAFYIMGHIYNKEGNRVQYDCSIRLTRPKTEKEKQAGKRDK